MNFPIELTPLWERFASPAGFRLALALIHFLWQGFVIALLAALFTRVVGRRSPHRRYTIGLAGLLAMATAPVVTFFLITPPTLPPEITFSHTAIPATETVNAGEIPPDELTHEIHRLDALIQHLESELEEPATLPPPIPDEPRSWFDLLRDWQPYLLLLWLVGTSVCALRLAIGAQASWRYRLGRQPIPEAARETLIKVAKRLGVKPPRVFVSERVLEAIVVGLFRPMILLPAAWIGRIPPELLEAVLAHEIAHLRRHDLWVNLAQRFLETLLFYHPAVWWLSRRVRLEREYCCDEIAARVLDRRAAYARALEFVAAERLLASRLATLDTALVAGMGGDEMALLNRVRRVLGSDPLPGRFRWRWATGGALLLPVCLWGAFLWADSFWANSFAWAGGEGKPPVVAEQPVMWDEVVEDGFGGPSDDGFSEDPLAASSRDPELPLATTLDEGFSDDPFAAANAGKVAAETVEPDLGSDAPLNPFGGDNSAKADRLALELEELKVGNEVLREENRRLSQLLGAMQKQVQESRRESIPNANEAVINSPPGEERRRESDLMKMIEGIPEQIEQMEKVRGQLEQSSPTDPYIEILQAQIDMLKSAEKNLEKDLRKRGSIKSENVITAPVPTPAEPEHMLTDAENNPGIEKLREEYEQALTKQLEALKEQRSRAEEMSKTGSTTPLDFIEIDKQIVEVMGKLLALKQEAAGRGREVDGFDGFRSMPTILPSPNPIIPREPSENADESFKPKSARATPANSPFEKTLDHGEYKIEMNLKNNSATVTFFDPGLEMLIHIDTPVAELPGLLERLSRRGGSEDAFKPTPASPFGAPASAVPIYEDPSESDAGKAENDPFGAPELIGAPELSPEPGLKPASRRR